MAAGTVVHPFSGWAIQLLFTTVGLGIALASAAISSPGNASSLAVIAFLPVSVIIGIINWLLAAFVGLPLRLIRPLWRWWNGHPSVTVIGVAAGAAIFALSLVFATPGVEIDPEVGYEYDVQTPVWWLFWTGWVLLAFALAHFPIDARWRSAPAEPVRGD